MLNIMQNSPLDLGNPIVFKSGETRNYFSKNLYGLDSLSKTIYSKLPAWKPQSHTQKNDANAKKLEN